MQSAAIEVCVNSSLLSKKG